MSSGVDVNKPKRERRASLPSLGSSLSMLSLHSSTSDAHNTSQPDANKARRERRPSITMSMFSSHTADSPRSKKEASHAINTSYEGVAELLEAAAKNDVYLMSKILAQFESDGLSINSVDPMGRTALHEASKAGAAMSAKFCLDRAARPSLRDAWNATPLDDAMQGEHDAVQTLLISAGGKVGSLHETKVALFSAVSSGDVSRVQSILTAGCPVSSTDEEMRTPLHVATARGDLAMISCLIKQGAKLDAIDAFGLTPLGTAARHGARSGENKVRDLLAAAGADTELSGETRKQTQRFVGVLTLLQLLFVVLFATCTRYSPGTTDALASPSALKTTYSMFMDVHVMIFIGFGYLMTFLRKYGHSSVGLNFLIGAFILQWHVLCGGLVDQAFNVKDGAYHLIEVDLHSLLLADFAAAVVLITFGALLGKVSPLQILALGFLEIILFCVNEQLLLQIGILDVGGSIIVHLFGAYFGLAASWLLSPKAASDHADNSSVYHSDLFAMIGTVFLWIYWPSFVASPAGPRDQQRAIVACTLSLAGSCVSAFVTSLWLRKGKFSMVDVQNATLAGGVAIGSAANLAVLSPAEAVVIGVIGGVLSVVGYAIVQPKIEKHLRIHDTCGVHNLHGMPAIFAGVASAIVVAYSGDATTWVNAHVDGAAVLHANQSSYHAVYGSLPGARGRSQAGYQLLCVVVSFGVAVVGGLVSALLVRMLSGEQDDESDDLFVDKKHWDVPSHELPFFFDRRGEINRETVEDALEGSKHGGRAWTRVPTEEPGTPAPPPPKPDHASAPAGNSVTNDLLNMKLDLVLQNVLRAGTSSAKAVVDAGSSPLAVATSPTTEQAMAEP